MDLNLKDRHALVCGASQGIGKAAAFALAAHGATITLRRPRRQGAGGRARGPARRTRPAASFPVGGFRPARGAARAARDRARGAAAGHDPGEQLGRARRRPGRGGGHRRLPQDLQRAIWCATRSSRRRCCRRCAPRKLGPHRQRDLDLGEGTDQGPRRVEHGARRGRGLGQDAVGRARPRQHHGQQRAAGLHQDRSPRRGVQRPHEAQRRLAAPRSRPTPRPRSRSAASPNPPRSPTPSCSCARRPRATSRA